MKIAVLCGGRSSERDVSLSTGIQVARALRETGHDVVLVDACVDFPLDCRPEEVFEKALPIENHAIGAAAPCVKSFFDRASGFFGKNVLEICKSADIVFNAVVEQVGFLGYKAFHFPQVGGVDLVYLLAGYSDFPLLYLPKPHHQF